MARLRPARMLAALLALAWVAAPFLGAGALTFARAWAYLAALLVCLGAHSAHVARKAPALRARRRQVGAGTPGWDLAWVAVFWTLMVALPFAAGLEARAALPPLPVALGAAGAALLALAFALSAAAMAANPFFEGTVRLQPDQRVVDSGPYRALRHPGYAALALWALATPLLLRSRWALAPALVTAAWVALRTALEDRLLRAGLAGYEGYARRVRWRLLPGVW